MIFEEKWKENQKKREKVLTESEDKMERKLSEN